MNALLIVSTQLHSVQREFPAAMKETDLYVWRGIHKSANHGWRVGIIKHAAIERAEVIKVQRCPFIKVVILRRH